MSGAGIAVLSAGTVRPYCREFVPIDSTAIAERRPASRSGLKRAVFLLQ
jgi:hypothetical protein